jgi:diguanylate cyclase (GGDEF)-like protein
VQYFVAIAHDVTERRRAEREYRHLAAHDALTELPNRAWFTQRLGQAIGRARRSGSLVALYFVDLDGFKPINDRFGHDAGDQVLYTLAGRLDRVVRPGDTVARYGGDEFTILCEDLPGEEQAAEIATRILETVGRKLRISDAEVQLTASVGVVLAGSDEVTPADLIGAADAAMYEAKQAGKATFRMTRLP